MINITAPRNLLPVSPYGNETNNSKTPKIAISNSYEFKDHINLNYRLTDLLSNTEIGTLTKEGLTEINEQLRRSELESLGALKKYAEDGNREAIELIVQLYVFRDVENKELSAGLSSLVKEVYEKSPRVVVEIARELTLISLESVGKDGDFRFELKAEINQRLFNKITDAKNLPILLNPKYSLRAAELWCDAAKLVPSIVTDMGGNKTGVQYDALLEARAAVSLLEPLELKTDRGMSHNDRASDNVVIVSQDENDIGNREERRGSTFSLPSVYSVATDYDIDLFDDDDIPVAAAVNIRPPAFVEEEYATEIPTDDDTPVAAAIDPEPQETELDTTRIKRI